MSSRKSTLPSQDTTVVASEAFGPAPPLRWSGLWWALGWALVLFITYSTLAPEKYVPNLHLWDKLEHAGAFFGMTFWFAALIRRRRYPVLGLWMLLFGGAIEIAQGVMGLGRDMDIHDWYADAIGIGVALLLAYAGLGEWLLHAERFLGLERKPR